MKKDVYLSHFYQYVSQFDLKDPRYELKVIHTLKTADLCFEIAKGLHLTEEDSGFAWLSGLLHDIGRFEQIKRYDTFMDNKSTDHAELGADLLFKEGLIDSFPVKDVRLMEKVIRVHNKFEVDPSWTEREKMFANILRDADKIDIIRVNLESSREVIYGFSEKEFKTSLISPEVMDDLKNQRTILRSHKKTAIDYLMGHIAFLYGLIYPISVELLNSQGYYPKLLAFQSDNPDTEKQLEIVRRDAQNYIRNKQAPDH